mmetsp:Transcript_16134/g.46146  ORF Transcript_16134/g.46146 Transcript_16134/m.46146 type:complete len:545 (-) Transcript_16134:308-1942(-)
MPRASLVHELVERRERRPLLVGGAREVQAPRAPGVRVPHREPDVRPGVCVWGRGRLRDAEDDPNQDHHEHDADDHDRDDDEHYDDHDPDDDDPDEHLHVDNEDDDEHQHDHHQDDHPRPRPADLAANTAPAAAPADAGADGGTADDRGGVADARRGLLRTPGDRQVGVRLVRWIGPHARRACVGEGAAAARHPLRLLRPHGGRVPDSDRGGLGRGPDVVPRLLGGLRRRPLPPHELGVGGVLPGGARGRRPPPRRRHRLGGRRGLLRAAEGPLRHVPGRRVPRPRARTPVRLPLRAGAGRVDRRVEVREPGLQSGRPVGHAEVRGPLATRGVLPQRLDADVPAPVQVLEPAVAAGDVRGAAPAEGLLHSARRLGLGPHRALQHLLAGLPAGDRGQDARQDAGARRCPVRCQRRRQLLPGRRPRQGRLPVAVEVAGRVLGGAALRAVVQRLWQPRLPQGQLRLQRQLRPSQRGPERPELFLHAEPQLLCRAPGDECRGNRPGLEQVHDRRGAHLLRLHAVQGGVRGQSEQTLGRGHVLVLDPVPQ